MNAIKAIAAVAVCAALLPLSAGQRFDVLLNMVHDNPGEAPWITDYKNPAALKRLGYTGEVVKMEPQCGLTFDRYAPGVVRQQSEERIWIERKAAEFRKFLAIAKKSGMPVYPHLDMLVVPKSVMDAFGGEMKGGRGLLTIAKPRTQEIVRAQLDELFWRYPDLGGIVVRFGETYLHDTPHHVGGRPVHNPADHEKLINLLREEVCVKRGKKVFYRTWDFGQLHTQPKLYHAAFDRVEPHTNLYISVKHTNYDFCRGKPFNTTLGLGRVQQIVEVSVNQGGLYGKNAYPYYFAKGVIDGFNDMPEATRRGVRSLLGDEKVRGLWLWTWGDGWKGPYFDNEMWMNLNEALLRGFTHHPEKSEEELFFAAVKERFGLSGGDARKFRQFCLLTEDAVYKGQHTSLAHVPNQEWWCRDHFFCSVDLVPTLKAGKLKAVLDEKREAVGLWRELERRIGEIHFSDAADEEFARVSTTYGRIKYEISEIIWRICGRLAEERVDKRPLTKEEATAFLAEFDGKWGEWEALKASSPYCPTLYQIRCSVQHYVSAPLFGTVIDRLRRISTDK